MAWVTHVVATEQAEGVIAVFTGGRGPGEQTADAGRGQSASAAL